MSILFRKPPHTWDPSKLLREEGYPSLNIFWLEDLLETWLVGNLQPLRNILSESIFHSDDVFPLVKLTGDSISEEEYIVRITSFKKESVGRDRIYGANTS